MIEFMAAFTMATLVHNFGEWFTHKYILRGLGKKKSSFFHYHWVHHHTCRKNKNSDSIYAEGFANLDVVKEFGTLVVVALSAVSWYYVWPMFFFCTLFWIAAYFVLHGLSHTKVEWGKKYMPWHFQHHMGKNQDLNWCVTFPLMDYVMQTRKKY